MYRITSNGLRLTNSYKVEAGRRYFLGASSSPRLINVTKIDEKFITYRFETEITGQEGEKKVETWIGQDLIAQGMATASKTLKQMKRDVDEAPWLTGHISYYEEVLS